MKNKLEVSVITLNYKEAELTRRAIDKLLKSSSIAFELIVVDNSCQTSDKNILAKITDSRVRVFTMEENLGCAKGYNFGIKKSCAKYVFIMNNDTEIHDKKMLKKMFDFLEKNSDIAVVQPKIKSLARPEYFEYAGAAGGFLDTLGYPFCRGRIFNISEKDHGQYDTINEISWASTCAFFVRRKVLFEAGLFDPIYFAYAEEVDMSLKIWQMGYRIVSFPKAVIYHKGETSWKKIRGKKTYLIHRNHLILYFKCFPLRHILILLPERLLLEFVSMFYYIGHRSYFHIVPVFISYISVIILFPKILARRDPFFHGAYKTRAPLYYRSIVIDKYFRKKRYFRELSKKYFMKA